MSDQQDQVQNADQQLHNDWGQIRRDILDTFPEVSMANLAPAKTINDLAQRIASRTGFSERLVLDRLVEIASHNGQQRQQGRVLSDQQQGVQGYGQQGNQQQGVQQDNRQDTNQYATAGGRYGF
jgi:hypothetical protein